MRAVRAEQGGAGGVFGRGVNWRHDEEKVEEGVSHTAKRARLKKRKHNKRIYLLQMCTLISIQFKFIYTVLFTSDVAKGLYRIQGLVSKPEATEVRKKPREEPRLREACSHSVDIRE